MSNSSTYYKRRQSGRKAENFRTAWKNQSPESVFSGKSLEDLEGAIAALDQANEKVEALYSDLSAAQKTRDDEEKVLNGLLIQVIYGVRSDPAHGDDSGLYRSMGFIPKSERKSGLTRRSKAVNKEATA